MARCFSIALAVVVLVAAAGRLLAVEVSFDGYDPKCGIEVRRAGEKLHVRWQADGAPCEVDLALEAEKPLLARLAIAGKSLAEDLQLQYRFVTGTRAVPAGAPRFVFFDRPLSAKNGPVERFESKLDLQRVQVRSEVSRAEVILSKLSGGPFAGDLMLRFYDGSPLVHLIASLTPNRPRLAYCYEAHLAGHFATFAFQDNQDRFVREPAAGPLRPRQVRFRTILSESPAGSLALVAPPHAYMFPRDHSTNFGFVQAGAGRMGLRAVEDDPAPYVPWIDAPQDRPQQMSAFLLLSGERAEAALERVKRYTHGDQYLPLAGQVTFTSHWHARLTVNERSQPKAPEFKRVMQRMGVSIVHLAEFHGDGHPRDVGQTRLDELRDMFELCRRYSDERFLLLPGEEANAYLGGHWLYLFPKPVYLTLAPKTGLPAVEEVPFFGRVHHPQDEAGMARVLKQEGGLAWTAHPRIKSSSNFPDGYRDRDWYQDDDLWLGATWKAMPADLSDIRLGVRSLELLADMNQWGQRKHMLGEVDTFELDATHENYGHMNVNYLRLDKVPSYDDWSPVLDVLRRGDFFVTTGEVLIHDARVRDATIEADLEWTFPLAEVVLTTSDGKSLSRERIKLAGTREFGRQKFAWPLKVRDARWCLLEAWDMAGNGAFTQPLDVR